MKQPRIKTTVAVDKMQHGRRRTFRFPENVLSCDGETQSQDRFPREPRITFSLIQNSPLTRGPVPGEAPRAPVRQTAHEARARTPRTHATQRARHLRVPARGAHATRLPVYPPTASVSLPVGPAVSLFSLRGSAGRNKAAAKKKTHPEGREKGRKGVGKNTRRKDEDARRGEARRGRGGG